MQFLGLAPGFVGLAQANILLPNLPAGDYPLVIVVGGAMSTSAVISIQNGGNRYTSPLTLVGQANFGNDLISNVVLYGNTAYVCGANQITMVDVTTPRLQPCWGRLASRSWVALAQTAFSTIRPAPSPF